MTKMGSMIGHRIDHNGVGVRRGQRHIPSKTWPKYSPPGFLVSGFLVLGLPPLRGRDSLTQLALSLASHADVLGFRHAFPPPRNPKDVCVGGYTVPCKIAYRWFSRYVIAAMLVDENKRFLISSFCSSTSNCTLQHCYLCP